MSDTFFTAAPHWRWLIIFYFFVGGVAGGAYFLGAVLEWFGRPDARPVIRAADGVGLWGAGVRGLLLTLDLGRPLRFWHMLFQSANLPHVMFKAWSPISFGAWALLLFGGCAILSARLLREGTALAKLVAAVGGLLGFFVAGYTGVLLSVTSRPIWADSPWLGALFGGCLLRVVRLLGSEGIELRRGVAGLVRCWCARGWGWCGWWQSRRARVRRRGAAGAGGPELIQATTRPWSKCTAGRRSTT